MNQVSKQNEVYSSDNGSLSNVVPARLIDVFWSHPVALSTQVSLEIIESPELLKVPGSKCYFDGLMHWQNRWIPAINMKALLTGSDQEIENKYALIVLYRYPNDLEIHYGAIMINSITTVSDVGNLPTEDLPENSKMWPLIADSCFGHQGQAIPILNIQSLFCYSYEWDY